MNRHWQSALLGKKVGEEVEIIIPAETSIVYWFLQSLSSMKKSTVVAITAVACMLVGAIL